MHDPTILIVDDSAVMRASLSRALRPISSSILVAENGLEGLEMARRNDVDVILSDVDMPKLDGIGMCRKLKEDPSTLSTPVILISSFDSDADIERGFSAGATAYLAKTDGASQIVGAVRDILQKDRYRRNQAILVLDDSEKTRTLVADNLRRSGFRVLEAPTVQTALEHLEHEPADLILAEIEDSKPEVGNLLKVLKDRPDWCEIPVIAMAAMAERGRVKRLLQDGATAFLAKPFNLDELVALVERILADRLRLLMKEKERLDLEHRLILGTISSLVSALEARDAYTRGHSEAVASLVARMLEVTGASRATIERAWLGGRLHDIGKIGVPDRILLKPESLTPEEFEIVRKHPVIGARILANIPSLADIQSIVRHHHERFDGRGYPNGLAGDDIPLLARYTAVADTYHALISARPYRPAQSHEQALDIICEVSGTQLCPQSVDVFLEMLNKTAPEALFSYGRETSMSDEEPVTPRADEPAAPQTIRKKKLDLPPPPVGRKIVFRGESAT